MYEEEEEEFKFVEDESFMITAYPEEVHFKPTFQGVFGHFTLFISNPTSSPQKVSIFLDTNSYFSVATNELTISPGIVYSLIITFVSDEAGDFETDLEIQTEHDTIVVPLSAQCISSPLIFNENEIMEYQFSMSNTSLTFNIANRSLIQNLHVLFDFDSASFSIVPPSIDLPPFSMCPVQIKFDSNLNVDYSSAPHFHIQCSESGDSLTIPLAIVKPNTSGYLELGITPVGVRVFKEIKLPDERSYLNVDELPELQDPFSFQIINKDNDEDNNSQKSKKSQKSDLSDKSIRESTENIIFSFCSDEPGEFMDSIQFGPLKFTLHAIAASPPFSIQATDDSTSNIMITNITSEKRSYYISFDPNFNRKRTTKISLEPGDYETIDTFKSKGVLYVKWRERDQKVVKEIELPTNAIEVSEANISFQLNYGKKKKKSVQLTNKSEKSMKIQMNTDTPEFSLANEKAIVLRPHSKKNIDIEFKPKNPQNIKGILKLHSGPFEKDIQLQSLTAILSSSNLISFFRMENQESAFILSFCGPKTVFIDKPKWINCEPKANSNVPIKISCRSLPSTVSCGYLKLEAKDSQPLSIPIIAYKSQSDLSVHVIRPYVLLVQNHGLRTAFVTFTIKGKNKDTLHISPKCAFIPFNKKVIFTFSDDLNNDSSTDTIASEINSDSESETEESNAPEVIVHSGDEILRQILSYLDPDNFYSRAFDGYEPLHDEISSIPEDLLNELNVKEFNDIFHQMLSIQTIQVDKVNHDIFTVGSQKIDFGELGVFQTKEIRFWIENQALRTITLSLSSSSNVLRFPEQILIKSEQRYLLRMTISSSHEQEINDYLYISTINNSNSSLTTGSETEFVKKINIRGFIVDTTIKFEADVLNFGVCEVGRIVRGQLRLYNKKKERTKIQVSASPPFSCPKNRFSIDSGCFVLLPIHFTPLKESAFQGRILFEPENSHRFYIPVLGSALFEPPPQ